MKNKSFLGKTSVLTLFLVGFGWAVYAVAVSPPQQNRNQQRQLGGFSYAQLIIQGEDQVTFDIGGSEIPRTRSLDVTYRDLGGKYRATQVNLLNAIGQNGWELIQVGNNVWTFKRRN